VTQPRFRFDEFVLSPRQRRLLRHGAPVPLIPKYFDLLLLLVQRRGEAISKQTIFSEVWCDVVVSDGALSQAVRTLRRTLGDNPREPRFIRTVSRHGYEFVWREVVEERDEAAPGGIDLASPVPGSPVPAPGDESADALGPLVDRLIAATTGSPGGWNEARDAAERLHTLGTAATLAELRRRPHGGAALAVLREARWAVPGAGEVPLTPGAFFALLRLRVSDVGRTVARRWANAAGAGALGGAAAGATGGLVLYLSPASSATLQAPLALAVIGALAGALAAAGVGAGLAAAEALSRSQRGLALALCGAAAGAAVGALATMILRALLEGLIGVRLPIQGGAIDGLVLGGAAGLGYGVATRQPPGGGLAAPSGAARTAAAVSVGLCTAAGAMALALSGRLLVGGVVHEIARTSPDAGLVLAPLGRLIGETDFGPVTRTLLSAFEGGAFGLATAWGLTSRPPVRGD
jgi:DNA-binding winged helix-turn-helix (wHTH) protein